MWLLFIPILILVVLALMLTSLLGGLFWMMGSAWPWLLIGLGVWLFWHEDGRGRRRARGRAGWFAGPASAQSTGGRGQSLRSAGQQPSPATAQKSAASRAGPALLRHAELPIDVQVKVEQIRRKVDVLLGYADRFPPFSKDLYLVRQTASDYLPRTVNAFLSLPLDAVDRPLSAEPGARSARQELKAQLDLLDSKLDDIAQDLQRQDADRLLANRRFLESRFGSAEALRKEPGASAEVA